MKTLVSMLLLVTAVVAFADRRAMLLSLLKPAAGGVDPNLIGWWKLNDGSGTSAADATGNGNTGTLQGNPTWGTGPNSNGDLVLDGTGDYVDIANESNFDFERTSAFSLSCWINVNASATSSRTVLGKIQNSGNQPGFEIIYDTDNARLKFLIMQADGAQFLQAVSAVNSVPVSTWKFVAVTYDGGSAVAGCKIYINGSLAVDSTSGGPLVNTILHNDPVQIGEGSGAAFYGAIDDARVYNKELTSGEISTLNSAGAQ